MPKEIPTDILTGPRVTLRPPRIVDAEELFSRVACDPEVTRYLSWTPHSDVAESRRVIAEFFNVGDDHTQVIELRGQVVGLCGWRRPQQHAAELGYCLARKWWGQGIMSEAVSVLLDWLRNDPALYRVWATCHVDNAASAAVLRRSGLVLEGRLSRYAVLPNISSEPQDMWLFGKAVR